MHHSGSVCPLDWRRTLWVILGAVTAHVLRMPISIHLAGLVGPTDYGELGIVSGNIDDFGTLTGLEWLYRNKIRRRGSDTVPAAGWKDFRGVDSCQGFVGYDIRNRPIGNDAHVDSNTRESSPHCSPAHWSSGYVVVRDELAAQISVHGLGYSDAVTSRFRL